MEEELSTCCDDEIVPSYYPREYARDGETWYYMCIQCGKPVED